MYDIENHGDFRRWYDVHIQRNYWILGYFGGGAVNISEAYELAKQFAEKTGASFDKIVIDEVSTSRKYKYFKIMYSTELNQLPEKECEQIENVWQLLTD